MSEDLVKIEELDKENLKILLILWSSLNMFDIIRDYEKVLPDTSGISFSYFLPSIETTRFGRVKTGYPGDKEKLRKHELHSPHAEFLLDAEKGSYPRFYGCADLTRNILIFDDRIDRGVTFEACWWELVKKDFKPRQMYAMTTALKTNIDDKYQREIRAHESRIITNFEVTPVYYTSKYTSDIGNIVGADK